MFIGLDALACVAFFEAEFRVHPVEDALVDRDRIDTYLYALEVGLAWYNIKPRMLPNLVNGKPFLRIGVKYPSQQIICFIRNVIWRLKIGTQNLFVQVRCVWVLERQVAAYEGKEYDAARPDVHIRSVILLAGNHLGRSVAR